MIKEAEMGNFRGYSDKNNVIKFRPGINLVLGDNATGKSTIVTLILFNLLNKKIDVTKHEDYRTIEPEDLHSFVSKLLIAGIDGKDYTFEKEFSGKGSVKNRIFCEGKELKKYNQLEFSRSVDVQDFITEKFGARKEILEDVLIQGQDPTKLLWPVGNVTEVGKELSRLLRLEELQNIFSNAKSVENMLIEKAEEWRKKGIEVEGRIDERKLLPPQKYDALIKRLQSKRDKLKIKSANIESEINRVKSEKDTIQKQFNDLKKTSGVLSNSLEQIKLLKAEVKALRRPDASVEQLIQKKTKHNGIKQTLQGKLGDIRQKIGGIKSTEQTARRETRELLPQQKSNTEEYDRLVKELASLGILTLPETKREIKRLFKNNSERQVKLSEQIGGYKQSIKLENDYKNILSKAKANCPVCDTRLTPKQRMVIVAQKTKIIQKLKDQMEEGQEETEKAKKIVGLLDNFENTLKDIADVADRLSEAERIITSVERRLPFLEGKRVEMEDKIKSQESIISNIDDQISILEKFNTINILKNKTKELEVELKVLPKIEKGLIKVDLKIDGLNNRRMSVEGEIRELNPKIENAKDKLNDSEYWHDELSNIQYRTQTAYEFADEVRFAHEAAKLSLHEAFNNYCNMINSNFSWIWPRLYERTDLKQIELNVQIRETEEDYGQTLTAEVQLVRVDSKGNKLPFNAISSHGQRVLASIAFRVAFLNLLSKTSVPRILVLDEPTIWVDEKNRERLGQVLGTLVKEIKEGGIKIDQVIVVSHDSAFLNAIDPEASKYQCVKNSMGFCEVSMLS